MSGKSTGVEWVETTEEVVMTEECMNDTPAVMPVLEAAETPIQKLLDTVGHGDNPDADGGFYCEECLTLFQVPSDPANMAVGPSFILDFPASTGLPQRALLTLPYGLVVGRSSVPNAGVGVINHGPTVSPGMHFGPYEGDVTTRQEAMASDFSWEIHKEKDEYEYIDAARESHSNWMRYVNCARTRDETNLLAVQYKGSILFHCCRDIHPGDELMVWPSAKFLAQFSEAWSQVWVMKLNATESNATATSHLFPCPHCELTFTTESFLQRHTQDFHPQPEGGSAAEASDAGSALPPAATSLVVFSVDPVESKTCGDCGKTFKQIPHLRRHKLCVHSNRRPYCCPQCRRSFSQASGLIRHQLVHRKRAWPKDADVVPDPDLCETKESSAPRDELFSPADLAVGEETKDVDESETAQEAMDVAETGGEAKTSPFSCPDCDRSFTNEAALRKHKATVHEGLRPYVCTVCQKCFGQYTDLSRHLRRHHQTQSKRGKKAKEAPEGPATAPFSCAECSLAFASADTLQQHVTERHAEQAHAEQAPVEQAPVEQAPVEQAHAEQAPVEQPHAEQAPVEQAHAEQAPVEQPHAEQAPVEQAHAEQAPVEQAPVEQAHAEQAPVEQAHLEQAHVEQAPVEHREDDRNRDPDSSPQTSAAEPVEFVQKRQRPQRLGAGSKIAAITKLIAPKRRAAVACKKPLTGPGEAPSSSSAAAAANGKLPKNKRLVCNRCKRTYGNPDDLKAHTCSLKQLKCGQCRATFINSGFLKRHEQVAHKATSYSCERCGKAFSTPANLKQHQKSNKCMKYHCTSELFPCSFCQFSFTMKSYLIKHVKRHHPVEYLTHFESNSLADQLEEEEQEVGEEGKEGKEGKPYVCPHCGKSCASSKAFKSHPCFQQVKVLYLCNDCGKGFINHYGLKQHQRVHTGEKPYTCPHCGKSFSYTGQLNVHLRTHTGEKPYLCTHCGESFRQSGDLKRHERKHTGVRPHSCPECCKSFSRPQSLKAHQLLHLGQRMFKCTQCGKSFSRNYHLRRHHQKMHL